MKEKCMALPHHIPGSHNDKVHRENREKRGTTEKKTFTARTRLKTEKKHCNTTYNVSTHLHYIISRTTFSMTCERVKEKLL